MAGVVRMPAVLAGVTSAAVQSWLVEPGQQVEIGDPLAEVETDKAVVEYASEVAGTVGRLLVGEGASVEVGTPIAVILEPGESPDAVDRVLAAEGGRRSEAESEPPVIPGLTRDPSQEPGNDAQPDSTAIPGLTRDLARESGNEAEPEPEPPVIPGLTRDLSRQPDSETDPFALQGGADQQTAAQHEPDRLFASPLVRRLARERGIDLSRLEGTGPRGRIVRRDIDTLAAPPAATPAAATARPEPEVVPLSRMRQAIARRLTESKATAPHFYLTAHCRVDRLLDLRRELNELSERTLSINDFVLKAVGGALRDVPAANAVWGGDHLLRHRTVDIAVAVALEDGLVAPVVRDVDRLGLTALSEAVADLAERARAGRLQQHELEGGAFSVSNLGMYGVDEFSAILNPPQSGILAVAAAKQQPVVEQGELAVGTVMTVTLSADHRVIDGALAAAWIAAFVHRVENPLSLLL